MDIHGGVSDKDCAVCSDAGLFHDEDGSRGVGFEGSGGFGPADAGKITGGVKVIQYADGEVLGFVGKDGEDDTLWLEGFEPFADSRYRVVLSVQRMVYSAWYSGRAWSISFDSFALSRPDAAQKVQDIRFLAPLPIPLRTASRSTGAKPYRARVLFMAVVMSSRESIRVPSRSKIY